MRLSEFSTNFLIVSLATAMISCSTLELPEIEVDEGPLKFESSTGHPGVQYSDHFVFIGEKIELVDAVPPQGTIWFDMGFDAKYRVLEKLSGEFVGEIIEFRVFDHYGVPPFSRYKNVMLFISKHDGTLYHEKYLYYPVYRTSDGRWAGCGDPYVGKEYHRRPFTPKPLVFSEPLVFERGSIPKEKFKEIYKEPYFDLDGDRATCRMGAYVDELLEIERDSYLKARGITLD